MGGYLDAKSKKKQQDVENAQKAQEDADAQANAAATLGLTRSRDAATDAARAQTNQIAQSRLDIERGNAATAAARAEAEAAKQAEVDKKQKLLEAFQGQGLHYPKNYATMKPEQKIGYLQVRLNAAQKAGDTKTVSDTETEINRVATEAAATAKANAPPKPTYADLHPRERAGRTPSAQEVYFEQHGYSPPTYSEANPQTKPQSPNQTNSFTANRVMLWSSQHPGATDDQIRAAFPNVNKSIMDTVLGTGAAPAAPGGGGATKKTVSLKAAMALPNNKGKTAQQVQADITAHGYAVAP